MNTSIDKSVIESLANILKEIGSVRDCSYGPKDENQNAAWTRLTDAGRVLRSLLKLDKESGWEDLGIGVLAAVNPKPRASPQLPPGWLLREPRKLEDDVCYQAVNTTCMSNYLWLRVCSNGFNQFCTHGKIPLTVYAALLNQAGVTNEF